MVDLPTQLDEEEMQAIYNWVDEIPLSRPKRNIARDFSDGVLVAEVVKHYIPTLVELHNYSAAHSVGQKTYNWNTLNQKVFKKIGFTISKKEIEDVVNCVPDTIERILKSLQNGVINSNQTLNQINSYQERKRQKASNSDYMGQQTPNMNMYDQQQQNQYSNKENSQMYLGNKGSGMGYGMGEQRQKMVDNDVLVEKDQTIQQLKETIEILELKITKLEQLVKLKDAKIGNLTNKLQSHGIL